MMDSDQRSIPPNLVTSPTEPTVLTDKQRWLCSRLNELHAAANRKGTLPSQMLQSALHVITPAQRAPNPDWMAQAAHTLREVLYPFYKSNAPVKKLDVFTRYGVAGDAHSLSNEIGAYFGFLTSVAHHEWEQARSNPALKQLLASGLTDPVALFEAAIVAFEDVLFRALRRQLDIHTEIETYISEGCRDATVLRSLITVNSDAERYFFSIAPAVSLNWLRSNDFLRPISHSPEAPPGSLHRLPELDYLVRAAAAQPQAVVDFMLSVSISADRFRPDIIERFLWIFRGLPADQIGRLVPKLQDEGWPRLAARFTHTGFAYQHVFAKLRAAGDYASTLILAEAVLAIRSHDDPQLARAGAWFDPFCLADLEYTKVFEYVASVDDAQAETALSLVTRTLGRIVDLGSAASYPPFAIKEPFSLLHRNLFELELSTADQTSPRENIEDLAALVVFFLRKTIGQLCGNATEARRVYKEYVTTLPDSRSTWCIRLVAISLCPQVFLPEIKEAIFRIFDCDEPWVLTAAAEYHRLLRVGLGKLAVGERADYFSRVVARFACDGAEIPIKNRGWKLLSSVSGYLSEDERSRAHSAFGKPLDPSLVPGPAIERGRGGWVSPKGPVTSDEFSALSLYEAMAKLRGEWSPARLREQDTVQDFLNPLNAEGMGRLLKADFPCRPRSYFNYAEFFFDRADLHPHYTYAFLTGVTEAVKARSVPTDASWTSLIPLMSAIVSSGAAHPFDRSIDDRESGHFWLAGWDAVYRAAADLLEALLKGHDDHALINVKEHRAKLLGIISGLLLHPDPEHETEAKSESDPFTNAVNSIRGDGLQALVWFIHREAQTFPKDSASRIASDVRAMYDRALAAEQTMAVRFLFGHELISVYVYDRDWADGLLPKIFPAGSEEMDQYLAAWEGYLARNPYAPLLFRLDEYYRRALEIDPARYTKRRYHTELGAGMAKHLAAAFVYAPEFGPNCDLLKLFWKIPNVARHKHFVLFIGRHCILQQQGESWAASSPVGVSRLEAFWDWALDHCTEDDVLAAFGYWMRVEAGVFERKWLASHIRRTVEKTKGVVEWQHGMLESLNVLATEAPDDVLQTLRILLLSDRVRDPSHRNWVYVDDTLVVTFKCLYQQPATKEATRKLVNDLLPLDSEKFWRLKEALQD